MLSSSIKRKRVRIKENGKFTRRKERKTAFFVSSWPTEPAAASVSLKLYYTIQRYLSLWLACVSQRRLNGCLFEVKERNVFYFSSFHISDIYYFTSWWLDTLSKRIRWHARHTRRNEKKKFSKVREREKLSTVNLSLRAELRYTAMIVSILLTEGRRERCVYTLIFMIIFMPFLFHCGRTWTWTVCKMLTAMDYVH